jgi:hypothetical protein
MHFIIFVFLQIFSDAPICLIERYSLEVCLTFLFSISECHVENSAQNCYLCMSYILVP